MDFYKKIIRSKKLRFRILRCIRFIPDKQMLHMQYFIKHFRFLNLKNPQRYTEKIQWYKLYYRDCRMQQCVDKFRVREYVKSKGLESILNELYAVYDDVENIDFDNLPTTFVLKTNNGSGTNIICNNKDELSLPSIKMTFNEFILQSRTSAGREWVYQGIKPCIIAEKLLVDPGSIDGTIRDYKFICFNGKPEYIVCDINRFINHQRNFYDVNWQKLYIGSDCPNCEMEIEKPKNLDKMLEVACILSEDFPSVRVDLYSIQNEVYFGELTFFPWSGYVNFKPDSFDFELGEKFILPEPNVI